MLKSIATVPFDEALETSAKEFAAQMGVDYATANGLLKFLESRGIVKCTPRKVEGQKGKPTNIYMLPVCVQLTFYEEAVTKVA